MLVDIEVALACQRKIEAAVTREQLQHVIEEANPCGHFVNALPIDYQLQGYLCLCRITLNRAFPYLCNCHYLLHPISLSDSLSATSPLVTCSSTPIVMRTNPSHPESKNRPRSTTPR